MESINIIEGLLTAAIKALPVEDFYKLRGEEPPKAGTDLTKATSGDLLHQLVVLGDVPLALGELSSEQLASELLRREDGAKVLPSHELVQVLIDRSEAGGVLKEFSSHELAQALIDRDAEGVLLKEVASSELAQALIDQGEEAELLNQVDITEYIDFESCADAYGSDAVLDYVECNLCIDDILHRLDEDEVAAWVAGTGRTVLSTTLESITKELAQVLWQHAEDAE